MIISVVIPVKNGEHTLSDVLSALFSQRTENEIEVIAIDSGSTDSSPDILRSFAKTRVHNISPSEFNHGLTRNLGAGMASGELVVLITQDAVPSGPEWLENLVEPFSDHSVAGVFCRQIPSDDSPVNVKRQLNAWVTGGTERLERRITDNAVYEKMSPSEKHIFCTFDNVCSCVRRKTWEKIPFRETDFAEDLVWSREVLLAGWKIIYQPSSVVIHSHERSLFWEYDREYVCHRILGELFGMRCVPSLLQVLKLAPLVAASDAYHSILGEPSLTRKIKFSLRAPFSAFMKLYGQYRGGLEAVRNPRNWE